MAIIRLEDLTGSLESLVFPNTYKQFSRFLLVNSVVIVRGRLSLKEDQPKVLASQVTPIDEAYRTIVSVTLDLSGLEERLLGSLKEKLALSPGNTPVYLQMESEPSGKRTRVLVSKDLFVEPRPELFKDIEGVLGDERILLTL
jgi:DNA polymerase-3 subunit alpha